MPEIVVPVCSPSLIALRPVAVAAARAYHLVMPERKAGSPALERFRDWLVTAAA